MKLRYYVLFGIVLTLILNAIVIPQFRKPEPNEPNIDYPTFHQIADPNWQYSTCSECSSVIHISESHFCPNYLLRYIPTWPEYIELEKDLVIIWPKEILEGGWDYQPIIKMSKGTKIYFKEDE